MTITQRVNLLGSELKRESDGVKQMENVIIFFRKQKKHQYYTAVL